MLNEPKISALPSRRTGLTHFRNGESQTAQLFARLRDDIMAGRLEPGRKLKIDELRKRYDAGASPLREALSTMCSDGLVERIDQRGFRVADVSIDDFNELLKTRCWLEERALRESIAHGGTEWEEALVLAHHRLSRQARTGRRGNLRLDEDWEAAHRDFHMSLIAACGSNIMIRFCDQLYDRNIRYRNISGTAAYPKRDIDAEHRQIFEAALNHDADEAVRLLVAHYEATGDYFRDALANN